MIDPDAVERKASELQEGDLVDLESIPELKDHPLAEYEFVEVLSVERDGDTLAVSLNGVEPVYFCSPDTVLLVQPRA